MVNRSFVDNEKGIMYSQTANTPRQSWFEARNHKSCCIFAQPYVHTNKSADFVTGVSRSKCESELTFISS